MRDVLPVITRPRSNRANAAGPWEISIAGAAVVVGGVLRIQQYQTVPFRAPNPDEWNWAWVGLSQLLGMPPTAWTLYSNAYPHSVWVAPPAPDTGPLVHPWVDAPPLFGWIIGLAAWLHGDRTLNDVINDPTARLIGIGLSITALLLAYVVARLVLGILPAMVGVWLLATAPIPVVLGRLVAAEQLLAVLLLAACLAVYYLRRGTNKPWWLVLLLVCCFVGPWVKVPGLVVGISAVLLLAARREFRLAAMAGGVTIAAQLLVFAYTWMASSDRRSNGVMAPARLRRSRSRSIRISPRSCRRTAGTRADAVRAAARRASVHSRVAETRHLQLRRCAFSAAVSGSGISSLRKAEESR